MEKLNKIFGLAAKFYSIYAKQYFLAMVKPLLAGVLAFVLIGISLLNKALALFSILSLPLIFYSFWQSYLITYALNFAAMDALKQGSGAPFEIFICRTKDQSGKLARWVTFGAFLSLVLIAPSIILSVRNAAFIIQSAGEISSFLPVLGLIFLNLILILPFMNYLNQAFYFKREDEGYFDLFFNCYKKLNLQGVSLIVIFGVLQWVISSSASFLSPIFTFALTPYALACSIYWYYGRLEAENNFS